MSTIRVDIQGLSDLTAQLSGLSKGAGNVVEETIHEAATLTANYAVTGVRGGAATGRVYRRRGVSHQASAPGQYPASDTGRLMGSINADLQPMAATVGSNLAYAEYLEFGTSRMAARPWLRPSFERAVIAIGKGLKKRIEALL